MYQNIMILVYIPNKMRFILYDLFPYTQSRRLYLNQVRHDKPDKFNQSALSTAGARIQTKRCKIISNL